MRSMRVWLRLLTVWIMTLALPLQGIAGAAMLHCGPGHERMAAAVEVSEHRHAAGHDAAAPHHHDAAAFADASLANQDTVAPAKAKSGTKGDLGQSKCSSCAACCAGAALPSAAPRLPQVPVVTAVFAESVVTVDAFASDGPDRPPRILPV